MTSELVADALMMPIWRRGWSQELPNHSDQGSQYSNESFQRCSAARAARYHVQHGAVGGIWDNSAMESFFSTSKTERVKRKVYRT